MKKSIAICIRGSERWAGGLYYAKNIAYSIGLNDYITNKYQIILIVDFSLRKYFERMPKGIKVIYLFFKNKKIQNIELLFQLIANRAIVVFPKSVQIKFLKITSIAWIPDFQHIRMPEMFTEDEIRKRNIENCRLINEKVKIVLSSKDCLNDFCNTYEYKTTPYVLHFVSYLEKEIEKAALISDKVLCKYGLQKKCYAVIPNQYWKHKNHIVAFKAIRMLCEEEDIDFKFVTTGNLQDYRNPEYINEINVFFEERQLSKNLINLGFIDRDEQIALMMNAKFILQPSLFEGWSTVVEDSRVLDKLIVISDIPLHREQVKENCLFFDPHDPNELMHQIKKAMEDIHEDDIQKGICDMRRRAKEYSASFQKIIEDIEKDIYLGKH